MVNVSASVDDQGEAVVLAFMGTQGNSRITLTPAEAVRLLEGTVEALGALGYDIVKEPQVVAPEPHGRRRK